MSSLRSRLLAAFAAVIFVALMVVIVAANVVTAHEFDVYVTRNAEAWSRLMIPLLEESYERNGDWQEADAILGGTVIAGGPGMMGGQGHAGMMGGGRGGPADDDMWIMMGLRFVLADAQGVVVADTGGTLKGETLGGDVLAQGDPVISAGQQIGTLIAIRPGESDTARSSFLAGVRRAVTLAALAAGLFALLLGTLLSRRITRPLRQLQEAAGTIAAGNLEARVPVTSGDELGSVANAFNQMAGRLGEQQALRKQMVADIAHELRTPISIMQGTLEAMIDGVLPTSAEELRDLHGDIGRLARLVEDLRTLSLADAGQLTLLRGAVDAAALAQHVVGRMAPLAAERNVALEFENTGARLTADADEDRLAQVLTNLLDNALRHTPPGGRVTLRAQDAGSNLVLEVRDTGSGIPPEEQPFVFERFWRGDRSRSRESGGSGLGLAIVRQLATLHGGTVEVESQPGQGSTFRVIIPRE